MAIPKIYKWTDGNAPVLNGITGSLVNLLTKCLVTGYGDKEPAGWIREFVNQELTIAAFRNNPTVGNSHFLKVLDNLGSVAGIQGYEEMTSESVGLYKFTQLDPPSVQKSTAADAGMRAWCLIASDTFFYLVMWYWSATIDGGTPGNFFCFGDFVTLNVEGYNSMAGIGAISTSASAYYGLGNLESHSTAASKIIGTPRNIAGVVNTQTDLSNVIFGPLSQSGGLTGGEHVGLPYDGQQLLLVRPYLIKTANPSDFRGWIPGLYVHCHNYSDFSQMQSVDAAGRTFLCIKMAYGGIKRSFFIETGVEWS